MNAKPPGHARWYAVEPGFDFRLAKAEHVRREPVAGEQAGTPPAKQGLRRQAQERRDLARGEEALARV